MVRGKGEGHLFYRETFFSKIFSFGVKLKKTLKKKKKSCKK